MTVTVDSFYPYVLPEVLGCPDPTLRQAIVNAARELCTEAMCWTEFQPTVALVENQPEYTISPSTDAYTQSVIDVWLGPRKLTPKTMPEISVLIPNWQYATSNEPVYYNQAMTRGKIRVFPIPVNVSSTPYQLLMRAAYVPLITATTLPDFLFERHVDLIASGAKARLMMMPGGPTGVSWANPGMGSYYKSLFDEGKTNVRIDEKHDRVPGSLVVAARPFGY